MIHLAPQERSVPYRQLSLKSTKVGMVWFFSGVTCIGAFFMAQLPYPRRFVCAQVVLEFGHPPSPPMSSCKWMPPPLKKPRGEDDNEAIEEEDAKV